MGPRAVGAAGVALVGSLLAASPAAAHDIHPPPVEQGPWDFLVLGVLHMLQGWDHLLFVLGVLIVAATARRAAGILTLFALGHSTTLIAAVLGGWDVSPEVSDALVAFSLVAVAGYGIFVPGRAPRMFAGVVFAFGLAHGLGLASRFADLDVPASETPAAVLLFNVGIELGQLIAVAVAAGVAVGVGRFATSRVRDVVRLVLLVIIGIAGVVATLWWGLLWLAATGAVTWPMIGAG